MLLEVNIVILTVFQLTPMIIRPFHRGFYFTAVILIIVNNTITNMETHMIRLKKLAGIINEDTNTNLMNKINKVTDPQTKKMLSDIAVIITDIKGNIMGIEEIYDWEHNNQMPSIVKEIKIANKTIDLLVKKLEAYITRVHK
jgi:hypothetical protein